MAKQSSFRLSEETMERLNWLAAATQSNKTEVLTQLINSDYDKLHGNKEMVEVLEKLNELNTMLKRAN